MSNQDPRGEVRERRRALSRWSNEGGAARFGGRGAQQLEPSGLPGRGPNFTYVNLSWESRRRPRNGSATPTHPQRATEL